MGESPERKLLMRNGVKSMRKNFELFQMKSSETEMTPKKRTLDECSLKSPFERVEEKDDPGRKGRQRLEEFIHSQEETLMSPCVAKRPKAGTVYDTIKHFALSEDKNLDASSLRKAMRPSESYQLLLNWINSRIRTYQAFVPQISDLSIATFNSGSVLAALAHSFHPFQTSFFQITRWKREEKLKFSWDIFHTVSGEAPVYSLEDALASSNGKLDRKCLLAMLFLIREKVILQNVKLYNQK